MKNNNKNIIKNNKRRTKENRFPKEWGINQKDKFYSFNNLNNNNTKEMKTKTWKEETWKKKARKKATSVRSQAKMEREWG